MELCNRGFSNITQIASHDSAFMGILPMDNQNIEVSAQLDSGVRFLQAQTHLDGLGRFSLCHTDCGMKDSGSIQDFLAAIINWLDTHPIEVVTLLLTNGDYVSLRLLRKSLQLKQCLTPRLHSYTKTQRLHLLLLAHTRLPHLSPLHPQRIHLLLGNPLRHHRSKLPTMHHQSAGRAPSIPGHCLRAHDYHESFP